MTDKPHLTPRELQVLHLMADGFHNKEIAKILNISEHTAKFHVNSIITKSGQSTRLGAVIFYLKADVIKLDSLMLNIDSTPEPASDA